MRSAVLVSLTIGLTWAAVNPGFAQPEPMKWGKVTAEDFRLIPQPADSEATAIVLSEYGVAEYKPLDDHVEFKKHVRVKILTEAGYSWGSVVLHQQKDRKIKDVKGQTFIMDDAGKVQKTKLNKKSILKEEVSKDNELIRFTLPALAPGAIVEYQYTQFIDGLYFLPSWSFQSDEPVLWSEYRAIAPTDVQYVFAPRNVATFDVEEVELINRPDVNMTMYRWALRDLPAVREEPFVSNPSNQLARLDVQLLGYVNPSVGFVTAMKSWQELAGGLLAGSEFRDAMDPGDTVIDAAKQVVADIQRPKDRMVAIYDHVRTTVNWNGEFGFYPKTAADNVLEQKSAGSSGVNFLLIGMLRAAGLEALPVLVSTREHGRVIESFPLLEQFNYVLAYVEIGRESYLLDATERIRPYDLLPGRVLNGKGLLVRERDSKWIPVSSDHWYEHTVSIDANLHADGTLTGNVESVDRGYSALMTQRSIDKVDVETVVRKNLLQGLKGVEVDSIREQTDDVNQGIRLGAAVTVPAYARSEGEYLYVNPMIVGRMDENPLSKPERSVPLDMTYKRRFDYTISIALPDDYRVVSVPENVIVRMPLEGGSFKRMIAVEDNAVLLTCKLELSKTDYPVRHYAELREVFAKAVATSHDQVVLKRTPLVAGSSGQ